jgi:phage-related protein
MRSRGCERPAQTLGIGLDGAQKRAGGSARPLRAALPLLHGPHAKPIGGPHCAPLGSGLWEVRSALAGNRISRVIFCLDDGYMILLHGFVKKTQKTRPADINLALKRKSEVSR